ncbi:hypothetical protein CEE39_08650 [bacterium (candidate division B38) B3_B38]|nr:MAG: hypothetical protein CEE39_08650 [bacterium (candidate division B38) B3_B38]
MLDSRGCDIIAMKNILGHKMLKMTQRYAYLILDRHEKSKKILENFWDTVSDTQVEIGQSSFCKLLKIKSAGVAE